MKFLKFLFIALLFLNTHTAKATDFYKIQQEGIEKYGYNKPVYYNLLRNEITTDQIDLFFIAKDDDFPFYSEEQGSVFYEIFSDLMNKEHIAIRIINPNEPYEILLNRFEKIMNEDDKYVARIHGIFGIEYDNVKYSSNKFLYPSFAENKIHLITSRDKNINISTKEDLKKYKGYYVSEDKISKSIEKDFIRHNISKIDTFDRAFEELLTGRADFIVASFYKSQIFLYQNGLRDYVAYSTNAIWKMPLFIKLTPRTIKHQRIAYLKDYLKSKEYKEKIDKALNKMLEFYKENTKGIIPPTYLKSMQTQI